MNAPVAVIIPAFRSAATLPAALASVRAQTTPPAEIVVVDDGSPEDLAAVVAACGGGVRLIRQENRGPASARNRGVAETTAPLLAFLDADDAWLPERLARTLAALEARPDATLAFADAWDWDGEHRLGRRHAHFAPPAGGASLETLVRWNYIPILTVLLRRQAFLAAGGFDEDRRLMAVEDYDLWLRVLPLGPAIYLPEPLALYRRSPGTLSTARNLMAGVTLVHQRLRSRGPLAPALARAMRRREGTMRLDLAWDLLGQGRHSEARTLAWSALPALPLSRRTWGILARSLLNL